MKQKYGVFRSGGPVFDFNILHKTAKTEAEAEGLLNGLAHDEMELNEGYEYSVGPVSIDAIGQYDDGWMDRAADPTSYQHAVFRSGGPNNHREVIHTTVETQEEAEGEAADLNRLDVEEKGGYTYRAGMAPI